MGRVSTGSGPENAEDRRGAERGQHSLSWDSHPNENDSPIL